MMIPVFLDIPLEISTVLSSKDTKSKDLYGDESGILLLTFPSVFYVISFSPLFS